MRNGFNSHKKIEAMINLLKTKLYFPPFRPNLVPRPSLVEKLNLGLSGPLTLIAAPAGYGKTTLMCEWRATQGLETPAAWLSLEASDNDPARFWFYLISTLATLQQGLGEEAIKMLETSQPPAIESLGTVLINDLSAFPREFILILDDVHNITDPAIFQGIDFLLEHMSPNMHLVLLTRANPPLALSRLRARGQLTEIRARDLSFNVEESTSYLNDVMELALSSEDITALKSRTEGWIAGLQLAALSLRGRENRAEFISTFAGSHHYIADYLVDEVLSRLPESTQDFMLKTSILERLNASLCDALTGRTDGQTLLEILHQSNLFISPLDDERHWYRYHHLFSDLLRNRCRMEHADEINELFHRAAAWFESNGNLIEAINYYLAAHDFQQVTKNIKLGVDHIFSQRDSTQSYNLALMLEWLERLPADLVKDDPMLSLIYGQSAWLLGRRTNLDIYFQNAQQAYDHLVSEKVISPQDPEFISLPFEILVGRSMSAVYSGNYNLAIEWAEKAISLSPAEDQPGLADAYISLYLAYRELGYLDRAIKACDQTVSISRRGVSQTGVLDGLNSLGFMYQIQGHLKQAAQVYHQALQYAQEQNLNWMIPVPITYIRLGHLHYHWNDLEGAEKFFEKCFALCKQYDHTMVFTYGQIFLARLRCAQGKDQEALQTINEVERTTRQEQISAFDTEIEAHKAWIQARLGNLSSAAAWLEKLDLRIGDQLGIWQGIQAIQAAHVLVALGRLPEALELVNHIEAAAHTSGSQTCQIEALVIHAIALQRLGDQTKTQDYLLEAVRLAIPESYIRVFLNEGQPMADLLWETASRTKDKQLLDGISQLLEYFPQAISASDQQQLATESHPHDKISTREMEIMLFIAAGKSNQEIADELVIALGTVKRHIFNIYNKLGVNSRTECLLKARSLHMID